MNAQGDEPNGKHICPEQRRACRTMQARFCVYACAFLELAVELNSFSLGRVLPPRGFSCRAKYFAVGYLPDPACDDALDSDPVDPEFVAFPPESVEPEPELFALLEFEFVLLLEVWPEPEPLEDGLLLPLAELEFSDPEFVLLEFVPDSVVDEELEALCVEFC